MYEFYHEETQTNFNLDFDAELIVIDLIAAKNANYIDLVTLFFSIIFSCNFVGLVPYTQTITSQLLFTLILSSITMLLI